MASFHQHWEAGSLSLTSVLDLFLCPVFALSHFSSSNDPPTSIIGHWCQIPVPPTHSFSVNATFDVNIRKHRIPFRTGPLQCRERKWDWECTDGFSNSWWILEQRKICVSNATHHVEKDLTAGGLSSWCATLTPTPCCSCQCSASLTLSLLRASCSSSPICFFKAFFITILSFSLFMWSLLLHFMEIIPSFLIPLPLVEGIMCLEVETCSLFPCSSLAAWCCLSAWILLLDGVLRWWRCSSLSGGLNYSVVSLTRSCAPALAAY